MRRASTALAAIALLCLASSAKASYDPIGSGTTKLILDKGFLALLKKNGVKLLAKAPGQAQGQRGRPAGLGWKIGPDQRQG